MIDLLLSPHGRILRNRFWQGMVVLTVASIMVTAGSVMLTTLIGYLNILLIYPYICVYGKRLHDAGLTAWWVIGVWLANLLTVSVVNLLLNPFFRTADTVRIEKEMTERMASGDFAGMLEGAQLLAEKLLPLNLALLVLGNLAVALLLGMLATMSTENRHGPVPGRGL